MFEQKIKFRIVIILPCVALKFYVNELIGISGFLQNLNIFKRLIFEVVTLVGMIYIWGSIVFYLAKHLCPSAFLKVKNAAPWNSE